MPLTKEKLFEPITIGRLILRNRLVRSATAERLADPVTGYPSPELAARYEELARGGVGLIITGHAYVDRRGKAHPNMTSMADDGAAEAWRGIIPAAQRAGARVMMQINFAGSQADSNVTPNPLSPSGVSLGEKPIPTAAMTEDEILQVVTAFGQAARRVRSAGFDGVQIHAAHGYLVSQFLSPATNRRQDAWGGSAQRRRAFLEAVIREVRAQVGPDFPVWVKLGVEGRQEGGLPLDEGVQAAVSCVREGVDGIEISHADGLPKAPPDKMEARFLPLAQTVREAVGPDFPLALVNGFRTRLAMEEALGAVNLISLCRPLIAEPDLPGKLEANMLYEIACVRCNQCWPRHEGESTGCHNPEREKRRAALSSD
jgi:2,4-dienoyl-CoA reductase-like NADH-dependent reductase (Old Yellow Enzyme family)